MTIDTTLSASKLVVNRKGAKLSDRRASCHQSRTFDELEIATDKVDDSHTAESMVRPVHRDVARLKLGVSIPRRSSCENPSVSSVPNSPSDSWRQSPRSSSFPRARSSPGKRGDATKRAERFLEPAHRNIDEDALNRGRRALSSMDFDTASFSGDELAVLILDIFLHLRLHEHLDVTQGKLQLFIESVQQHMFDNPYHNWTHVADVFQATYALGLASGLMERLSPLEQFALLISALCHDLEHPGVNNMTLIKSQPELWELYGESCSLEKHHSLRAFSLMLHREVELLSGMDTAMYYRFRDMVTKIILATDMSRHAEYCGKVEQLVAGEAGRDVQHEMELLIKCADTSNVLRPRATARGWAIKIGDEFFAQGDLERSMGLSVTPTCDRKKQTLVGLQKSFIDYCIGPFFDSVARLWPQAQPCFAQVWDNRAGWDDYDDDAVVE
eukprot:CAMPEP_0196720628 /NCGR_PEP_ID=MMETSP1091-20130531/3380_1 /TAXON_ID=302021 /ORGANISM="Rhodomonas sp., Strain CCMP768" /LENGTH=441 /DNA_ID=CAMNT_0042061923 /DNA_START=13 /DNA_END=1338 /DNA_ORIENTATION=+